MRFFLFLIITDATIITSKTAIIAITPGHPSIATILLPNDIIIPANQPPKATAVTLVLKSKFKNEAANLINILETLLK